MFLREKFMKVPHDASDEILDIHDRFYKIYVLRTSLFTGSFLAEVDTVHLLFERKNYFWVCYCSSTSILFHEFFLKKKILSSIRDCILPTCMLFSIYILQLKRKSTSFLILEICVFFVLWFV